MESIYFDTCALNRLTDDQKQRRVRDEAEAVSSLLDRVSAGQMHWLASDALRAELSRNPNLHNRSVALAFLALASQSITPTPEVDVRAIHLQSEGLGALDALHFALAESAGVDWLFTVDDRFLKLASQIRTPKLQVANPLEWLKRRSLWLVKP